jgi:hypothetical protein
MLELHEQQPTTLFHVEDTYNAKSNADSQDSHPVVSGHVRYGQISLGDELLIGPYSVDAHFDETTTTDYSPIPTSRSFPGALGVARGLSLASSGQEWRKVRITSLRYLRLPVQTLYAGQVGTVGVQALSSSIDTAALVRLRKGMVLVSGSPQAKRGFVAEFARSDVDSLSIGMGVVVYIASVRASAKVLAGTMPANDDSGSHGAENAPDDLDAFSFTLEGVDGTQNKIKAKDDAQLLVTFQFLASREYVENGSKVLVMPGGGPGLYGEQERGEKGIAGLGGFVGRIVDSFG